MDARALPLQGNLWSATDVTRRAPCWFKSSSCRESSGGAASRSGGIAGWAGTGERVGDKSFESKIRANMSSGKPCSTAQRGHLWTESGRGSNNCGCERLIPCTTNASVHQCCGDLLLVACVCLSTHAPQSGFRQGESMGCSCHQSRSEYPEASRPHIRQNQLPTARPHCAVSTVQLAISG